MPPLGILRTDECLEQRLYASRHLSYPLRRGGDLGRAVEPDLVGCLVHVPDGRADAFVHLRQDAVLAATVARRVDIVDLPGDLGEGVSAAHHLPVGGPASVPLFT